VVVCRQSGEKGDVGVVGACAPGRETAARLAVVGDTRQVVVVCGYGKNRVGGEGGVPPARSGAVAGRQAQEGCVVSLLWWMWWKRVRMSTP